MSNRESNNEGRYDRDPVPLIRLRLTKGNRPSSNSQKGRRTKKVDSSFLSFRGVSQKIVYLEGPVGRETMDKDTVHQKYRYIVGVVFRELFLSVPK